MESGTWVTRAHSGDHNIGSNMAVIAFASHIILAHENAERRCQDVLLPVPIPFVSLGTRVCLTHEPALLGIAGPANGIMLTCFGQSV
jgi:hypothetical protein